VATDIEQKVAEAFVAIVLADSALQTVLGRTAGFLVPFEDTNFAETLPVLAYTVVTNTEIGGTGDNRLMTIQVSAFAQGNNARAVCSGAMERLELGVTQPAFTAKGVDAAVLRRKRYRAPIPPEETRAVSRADMDLTIWATK
jgi:hypothetical protein